MKISGFSFVRNGDLLGYPVSESIRSILPVCDEFIIAVGKGERNDHSRDIISSIGSNKIKIIDTEWKDLDKLRSSIYSQQTNIALSQCSGDWCFYIQCDEVVHEQYLSHIIKSCENYLKIKEVEGFLFNYKHFWGDYDHYIVNHKWYPQEIRIIRNGIGVSSIGDAQSFRRNNIKLNVVPLNADMYHYGYVRSPKRMQVRSRIVSSNYWGKKKADEVYIDEEYKFGSLEKMHVFKDTYPEVMKKRINAMDWKDKLIYKGKSPVKHKHDRLKYRLLTFIEQKIFRGNYYWGFKNFKLLKKKNL